MPAPDCDAWSIGRNQRRCNAIVFFIANQVVRIIKLESKTQDRCDGRQSNVSLVPVESDAGDLFAVPLPLADDTAVD